MGEQEARSLAEAIGANVRGRRAQLGLRQPDLAEMMAKLGETGWSASTVSKVEDGKRAISVSELLALALSLGATLEELLDPVLDDDTDLVEAVGRPFRAWRLRAIVRGMVRLRFLPDGGTSVSPTDRGGSAAALAFTMKRAEKFTELMQEETGR